MRPSIIHTAILASLGAFAMTVPVTASPTVSGSTHARPAHAIELQYALTCTAYHTDPECRHSRSFYKKHKSSKSKPKKTGDEK